MLFCLVSAENTIMYSVDNTLNIHTASSCQVDGDEYKNPAKYRSIVLKSLIFHTISALTSTHIPRQTELVSYLRSVWGGTPRAESSSSCWRSESEPMSARLYLFHSRESVNTVFTACVSRRAVCVQTHISLSPHNAHHNSSYFNNQCQVEKNSVMQEQILVIFAMICMSAAVSVVPSCCLRNSVFKNTCRSDQRWDYIALWSDLLQTTAYNVEI